MHETLSLKEALKRLRAIKTPFAKDIAGWLKDEDERYEDSEVSWYEGPVDRNELFMVPDVVIVNGDLKTSGSLLDCIDVDESFLSVLGNVEVDNLVSKGTIIAESGDEDALLETLPGIVYENMSDSCLTEFMLRN